MKIAIIGAGASGVIAAISIKKKHQDYDVVIFEHLDKPLKKILATGNGKCNIGNSNINFENYSNNEFVKKIMRDYSFDEYKNKIEELGFSTKQVGDLLYPISESAVTVRNSMLYQLEKYNVEIKLNEKLCDYILRDKIQIITNKNKYEFDKLIIATGGMSSSKLGSDGSIFKILINHNYKITDIKPGLCPIYVKQNTKVLDGTRVKATVTLDNCYKETGEVLFKEKGLSGIVIFNISSLISRSNISTHKIELDLINNMSLDEIKNLCKNQTNTQIMQRFLHPNMIKYFMKNGYDKDPVKYIKNLPFNFENQYGFDYSQVSVGGLEITEINFNFESNKEPGVYFLGEVLDIDGPCGGYNLTWAIYNAFKLNF